MPSKKSTKASPSKYAAVNTQGDPIDDAASGSSGGVRRESRHRARARELSEATAASAQPAPSPTSPTFPAEAYHDSSDEGEGRRTAGVVAGAAAADDRLSPLNTPQLATSPTFGDSGLQTPPSGFFPRRDSRYSMVSPGEPDDQSGRGTPAWLRGSQSNDFLSSAGSYQNLRPGFRPDFSRPNSYASTQMLMKDYDSTQHLNAVAMDKYESGSWDKTPLDGPAGGKHPREAHLAKWGLSKKSSSRRKCLIMTIIALIVFVIVVAVGVAVGVHFGTKSSDSSSSSGSGSGTSNKYATSGVNGSTIFLANGSSFTYVNAHGGTWASALSNDSAQAQSYSPPISEEWDFAKNQIFGVNVGGWLVTEPFIAPQLYQEYVNTSSPALDEYDLSNRYLSAGGQSNLETRMRQHYDTFITEEDFAQMAGAGLNWIRLPIPHWAFGTIDGEPYLANVAWEYVLKAIQWARKYGLRINLDLHTVPGGQNTYNHSGRLGYMSFLNGVMGRVNAERTLNIIREITEFISQPEIRKVVPIFSVLNEPNIPFGIGISNLKAFYGETYNTVRNITGFGAGNGPYVFFHDGFEGLSSYNGTLNNADRVGWDTHPYICFTPPYSDSFDSAVSDVCENFGSNTQQALVNKGVYIAGEWSLAINDCGLYLNNVGQGARYDGTYPGSTTVYGSCTGWTDWESFNQSRIDSLKDYALAQMSSLRNSFFWTWTIGDDITTGKTVNPMWNYKLGLQQGWMPTNISAAVGNACQSYASQMTTSSMNLAASTSAASWPGTFSAWQTGAAASYPVSIPATEAWPPTTLWTTAATGGNGGQSMTIPASSLPSYTPTGPIVSAATPTYSVSQKGEASLVIGNWFNTADNAPMYTAIAGCATLDPYYNGTLPTGFPCAGSSAAAKRAPFAAPTTAPLVARGSGNAARWTR